MASDTPDFAPDKFEIEQKGKMVLLYAVIGKTREHVASFFHDYKADYVTDALKEHYGVKITKKRNTATEVKPAAKATKTAAVKKAPVRKKRAV